MQSVSDFWNCLVTAGLVPAAQLEQLKIAAQNAGLGENSEQLAEWLVAQRQITRYQATGCLTGAFTTFHWHEFLILEPITRGPLEYQMRALHIPSQQPVILLELHDRTLRDSGGLWGMVQACELLFTCDSPYWLSPREILSEQGVLRVVLDDPRGTSLSAVLAGGTRLSESAAAAIAAACAEGLASLHALGLCHGGISPETIWLPRKGSARVLLAPPWITTHTVRPELEPAGSQYAAPECDAARPQATSATDLYALGCTLFEMLCGRPPFAGKESVVMKLERHRTEPIASLQAEGVSPKAEQIVRYLMAKDSQIRYQSAATVTEALQALIAPEDLPRSRPSTAELQAYLTQATARRSAALARLKPPPSPAAEQPQAEPKITTAEAMATAIPPSAAPQQSPPSSEASQAVRAIEQASQGDPSPSKDRGRKHRISRPLAWGLLLLICAVGIWSIVREMHRRTENLAGKTDAVSPSAASPTVTPPIATHGGGTPGERPAESPDKSNDDGKSLWTSPTDAERIQLRYLPPAPQMILTFKAERLSGGDWKQVLDVCGERVSAALAALQSVVGFDMSDIKRIDLGVYERGKGIETAVVVYLTSGHSTAELQDRWKTTHVENYAGEPIYTNGDHCYYQPFGKTGVFSVGSRNDIEQIIDWLGEEILLNDAQSADASRATTPLASLVESADSNRDVTIFFNANFIRSQRSSLFSGIWKPLHTAITWLLGPGEQIQAGAVSLHLDQTFFGEIRLYGTRDKPPDLLASEIYGRLDQAPTRINEFLLSLQTSEYSRTTLALFPDMLRSLVRYTRHDQDRPKGRQAVLRTHLPIGAAAHLALAAELILWEAQSPVVIDQPKIDGLTTEQKLEQRSTLVFDRDNLLQAVAQLADDVGIRVQVLGKDLEQEGITQNQSFGIHLENRPAREILLELLRRANPIKDVAASDEQQQLIYVINRGLAGGQETVWITTRTAAKQRGDEIPQAFALQVRKSAPEPAAEPTELTIVEARNTLEAAGLREAHPGYWALIKQTNFSTRKYYLLSQDENIRVALETVGGQLPPKQEWGDISPSEGSERN